MGLDYIIRTRGILEKNRTREESHSLGKVILLSTQENRNWNMLGVKSLTSDRWWPDNVFISGGNPHLTSRFCGVVLGLTMISKMVSEPLQYPLDLGHLLSGFRYRTTHHLCPRTKPNSAGREGVLRVPTSDRWWLDNMFISGGNPHLTS
jgi:hypothetical protein